MEIINNHYFDIPEERKLRLLNEDDARFHSFWKRMLAEDGTYYDQPKYRMKSDAWESLSAFFMASRLEVYQTSPTYVKRAMSALYHVYQLANMPGQEYQFSIGGRSFTEVGDSSIAEAMVDIWLDEICLAMAARHWRCVELMTIMDEALLRLKDPFDVALLEFVKGVLSNSPQLPELLQNVMEKSAPEYMEDTRVFRVHSLFVPFVNVFVALLDGDEAHYQHALQDALEAHYQFYNQEDEQFDRKGYVSLKLVGLAALAYDKRGWKIPDTVYLPKWLVYGEHDLLE